jgi:hypothetical protein
VSRGRRLILLTAGVLLFLVISGILARWLATENTERDAELALLKAQAAGDEHAMLDQLSGCRSSSSCRAAVHDNVTRLRRPGAVKVLLLQSHTSYALTSSTGRTRVAWTVIGRLPVVQCVLVHRGGNALTGISVTLLALSAPISNTGTC